MKEASYTVTRCDKNGIHTEDGVPKEMSLVVAMLIDRIGLFTEHVYTDPGTGEMYRIART